MKRWKWFLGIAAVASGGMLIRKWGLSRRGKEPKYKVLQSMHGFEIREYEPYIVAETFVEGSFEESGNEGFRRLAAYIFGQNQGNSKISMTAPVSEQGEKIEMTTPVGQIQKGSMWKITFVMPSEYTLETLPKPLDERITFQMIPTHKVAVKQFSGKWTESYVQEQIQDLTLFMENNLLVPAGEPIFARYNPPITPSFLRRNEVLIPLESSSQ